MSEIIITGASGFAAGALFRALGDAGRPVRAVSRMSVPSTHARPSERLERYSDLQVPSGATVVHLAEPSQADAYADSDVCAALTATLDRLLAAPFERFIYGSSAVVYGDAVDRARRPDETLNPTTPSGLYNRAAENKVLAAGGVVARPSNLYGPGMAGNNVLSDILRQLGGRGPLVLRDLAPVRDYLWIDDYAEGLATLTTGAEKGIFNFGTGQGTSVAGLAGLVLTLAGEQDRIPALAAVAVRASTLVLDISLTSTALNWVPNTPLPDGIRRLLGTS